jgi:hypothetical protein
MGAPENRITGRSHPDALEQRSRIQYSETGCTAHRKQTYHELRGRINNETRQADREKSTHRKRLTMHGCGRGKTLNLRKSAKSVDMIRHVRSEAA